MPKIFDNSLFSLYKSRFFGGMHFVDKRNSAKYKVSNNLKFKHDLYFIIVETSGLDQDTREYLHSSALVKLFTAASNPAGVFGQHFEGTDAVEQFETDTETLAQIIDDKVEWKILHNNTIRGYMFQCAKILPKLPDQKLGNSKTPNAG